MPYIVCYTYFTVSVKLLFRPTHREEKDNKAPARTTRIVQTLQFLLLHDCEIGFAYESLKL